MNLHSPEAERSVLSAMLLDAGVIATVGRELSPADFHAVPHGIAFKAMVALDSDGTEPDLVTLTETLRRSGDLARVGGAAFVASLLESATTAANWQHHARIIRELAASRAIRHTARELETRIEAGEPPTESAARAADTLSRLATPEGTDVPHVSDGMAELFTRGPQPYPDLGLEELSRLRVHPGNLCVIGARPSCGKTAMLGTMAVAAASRGWQVLFLSLEMPAFQIRQRLLAAHSRVPLESVELANDASLSSHATGLAGLPVWILDAAMRLDIESISGAVTRFVRKHPGNTVVMLDYLQLVTTRERHEKRYEVIGHICRELKRLAISCSVPVIVAAQLSRASEQRGKDSAPQLSDFRESGEIEQTADQALLMHPLKDKTFVRVAKYRMGPKWTCELRFVEDRCVFEDFGGWQ